MDIIAFTILSASVYLLIGFQFGARSFVWSRQQKHARGFQDFITCLILTPLVWPLVLIGCIWDPLLRQMLSRFEYDGESAPDHHKLTLPQPGASLTELHHPQPWVAVPLGNGNSAVKDGDNNVFFFGTESDASFIAASVGTTQVLVEALATLRAYPVGRDDGSWVVRKDHLLAYLDPKQRG